MNRSSGARNAALIAAALMVKIKVEGAA